MGSIEHAVAIGFAYLVGGIIAVYVAFILFDYIIKDVRWRYRHRKRFTHRNVVTFNPHVRRYTHRRPPKSRK